MGTRGIGFWEIVWTAGREVLRPAASNFAGFWGIVWTAGASKGDSFRCIFGFLGDSVDSRLVWGKCAKWGCLVFGG